MYLNLQSTNVVCDLWVTGEVSEKVGVIKLVGKSVQFEVGDNDMGVEAPVDYTTKKRVACCFRTSFKSGPSRRVVVEKAEDEI